MRSVIFSGLAFLLFGCDRTDSRGNEAVMPTSSVPQGEMCPDITGTFEFEPKSTAARFLVGKRWANQGFSLLRIESTSNRNNYRFTVKAPVEAFNAAAARLAEQNPKRHAEWEALLSERERAIEAGESRVVLDEKIAAIGPLPELASEIWRRQCAEYWLAADVDLDARNYSDVGDPKPDAQYDLELWFARNAAGDLLYRIDRYRLRDFLFGGQIRTWRSQHFHRLAAVDHDRFDWTLELDKAPEPVKVVPREALPSLVVGISQALNASLPEGAEITRFVPREVDAPQLKASPSLIIDVSGLARSSADVSNLLRSLNAAAGVSAIELISLSMTEANRVEFKMAVSVQAE